MLIETVTEGIFRLRLGRTNSYLVRREGAVVLVDGGLPTHHLRVLELLDRVGIAPRSVDRILLTHRHLDHAGSADSLRRRCQAEVVIHTADAAAVEGRQRLSPARGALGLLVEPLIAVMDHRVFGYRPCQVTPVEDGWREHGLQLIHLPGHTPGNSGYLHAASGVVFCGDAAINTSAGPKHPSKLFSLDPVQVRRSQLVLADLDAEIYCFGHGPPLPRGAAALRRLATER